MNPKTLIAERRTVEKNHYINWHARKTENGEWEYQEVIWINGEPFARDSLIGGRLISIEERVLKGEFEDEFGDEFDGDE